MRTGRILEALGSIGVIAGLIMVIASGSPVGAAAMLIALAVFIVGRFLE